MSGTSQPTTSNQENTPLPQYTQHSQTHKLQTNNCTTQSPQITTDSKIPSVSQPPPKTICMTCKNISLLIRLETYKHIRKLNPNMCTLSETNPCDAHLHYIYSHEISHLHYNPTDPPPLLSRRRHTFYNINISNLLLPTTKESNPRKTRHPITNPTFLELQQFCSDIHSIPHQQPTWPSITINYTNYYPPKPNSSLEESINNFNREPSYQQAFQFHPWESTELSGFEPKLLTPEWLHLVTLHLTPFVNIPAVSDTNYNLWGSTAMLMANMTQYNVNPPILLPLLLHSGKIKYLSDGPASILDNLSNSTFPGLLTGYNSRYTMAPVTILSRIAEIFSSLLAATHNVELFTPITGSVKILGEITPYIIIHGQPFISWNWIKQVIPQPKVNPHIKTIKGHQYLNAGRPIELHNWHQLHWTVALRITKQNNLSNTVVSLQSSLKALGTTATWINQNRESALTSLNDYIEMNRVLSNTLN